MLPVHGARAWHVLRLRMNALRVEQFQALLDGRGGKYVHADYVQNGATQIGGMTSMTPSMTAGNKPGQFGTVASKLAGAGPPRIRNLPSDFRTA